MKAKAYTIALTVTVEANDPTEAYRKMVHGFHAGQPPTWTSEGIVGPMINLHDLDFSRWFIENSDRLTEPYQPKE